MTQIIGTPLYAAGYLGKEVLTREQVRDARSIDNTYRVALGKISNHTHVNVYMGTVEKKILSTDLMVVLRDCRARAAEKSIATAADLGFFCGMLRKFGKMNRKVWLSAATLIKLRKIARGEATLPAQLSSPTPAPKPRRSIKQLLAVDRQNRGRKARSQTPRLAGCQHQDVGSGERCGAPCTGTHCDAHKNIVPTYNGSGSHFYALNKRESNPHRR